MRRTRLVVTLLTAIGGPLTAQETSILAGGVLARYADSISGSAGLLSVRLRNTSPSAAATIEGTFSQFAAGEWALQLGAHGTTFGSLGRGLFAGVSGSVAANNFQGGSWSGAAAVGPLLALSSGPLIATLGASVGGLRRVDESWLTVGTSYLRLGYRMPAGVSLEAGMVGTSADTIRYANAILGVNYRNPRFLVAVGGGGRVGDLSDDLWGRAWIELFPARWLALEGAVGRYPRDLSGFTNGVFATLGARVSVGRTTRTVSRAASEPALGVTRLETGDVRILIRYGKEATSVAIAGDWSGWTAFPLRREASGRWSIELQLEPGVYKYSLLVDGQLWTIPEGAPTLPDEFGGEVGLLIVR